MSTEPNIIVNGERRPLAGVQTILGLLQALKLDPARVAVELDGVIVKQPLWAQTVLRPGSQLEIVQFVGGG